jgi:hypothetical protein
VSTRPNLTLHDALPARCFAHLSKTTPLRVRNSTVSLVSSGEHNATLRLYSAPSAIISLAPAPGPWISAFQAERRSVLC